MSHVRTEPLLIGVNYFAGWREELPNMWHDKEGDWRERYPSRVPLLGSYITQDTVDREVVVAANHGIDFFQHLWYPTFVKADLAHMAYLNRGIACHTVSKEGGRLPFIMEFCNHDPYDNMSDADWQTCVTAIRDYMVHPNYLRIDGRPVLKIHTGHGFVRFCGVEIAAKRLTQLRDAVKAAGQGNPLIGCGVGAGESIRADHWAAKLFDFTNCYNEIPPIPQIKGDHPFDFFTGYTHRMRPAHVGDVIPYVPYVASGWNRRPWPDERPYFALPTEKAWRRELSVMHETLKGSAKFGFPRSDGSLLKAFTIFAWNEYGEGGIVAPSSGEGYMKVEAIRDEFGVRNRS